MKKEKKLTVISWDADYREKLIDSFECLKAQTVLDQLDIIHIEWTIKKKPEVLKYDFIKLVNMNLEKDETKLPCFDTALQWNLGLYLAKTPWLTYHHNDIVPADHYEKIIRKIENINESNDKTMYFEGWFVNQGHTFEKFFQIKRSEKGIEFYQDLKHRVNNKVHLIPDLYKRENNPDIQVNGVACTVNKEKMIEIFDGWGWNYSGDEPERGATISHRSVHTKGQSLRVFLTQQGLGQTGCEEIYTYAVPHPTHKKVDRQNVGSLFGKGVKQYEFFWREWLPQYLPSLL